MAFLAEYGLTIAFYATLISLIVLFRKKFEWQNKIIGLYKTKVGLKLMERIAGRRNQQRVAQGESLLRFVFPLLLIATIGVGIDMAFAQWATPLPDTISLFLTRATVLLFIIYLLILIVFRPIEKVGEHGIVIGFLGMLFIIGVFLKGLTDLFFAPEAPPVVGLVLPGVKVPGLDIKIPLVTGWLALFIVIVIHEFSHGVVSKAHKVKVKSSGLMVFGPIGGAFVEPDEEQLKKAPDKVQLSLFAAGPYSNILSGMLFALIGSAVLVPLLVLLSTPVGFSFTSVEAGAAAAGVEPGVIYNSVNGEPALSVNDLLKELKGLQPGDVVTLTSITGREHKIIAGEHPDDATKGYLGVRGLTNEFTHGGPITTALFVVLAYLAKLISWVIMFSLGLGLANLLPLGPVDGGRMLKTAAEHFFGPERGKALWARVSIITLVALVILFFSPMVKDALAALT
ncbi:hypothetical protein D6789_04780 [Candidatus Woesearchaeota archaeon]|nr:MAG: hypothetical protein D6789_04780 [Candidatus Woesearchaeota archaeon]